MDIFICIALCNPILHSVCYSIHNGYGNFLFCNYILTQSPTFLGLDNFKTIFADPDFRVSIINTLKWVVIQSTLHVLMGFIMALF